MELRMISLGFHVQSLFWSLMRLINEFKVVRRRDVMTIQMRHCVRAAQRGDKIAAEELIKAFKPYLHHQAKKYQRFYHNFDEALSTAYHGAIDCIYQSENGISNSLTLIL